MANPNPYKARLAKAQKRIAELKAGDVAGASRALWTVITDGLDRLERLGDTDTDGFSKLSNAIVSASREYRAMFETCELEKRIEELEQRTQ